MPTAPTPTQPSTSPPLPQGHEANAPPLGTTAPDPGAELRNKIGLRPAGRIPRWAMRLGLALLLCVAGVAGLRWWTGDGKEPPAPKFRTASIARGELQATVTATGTLSGLDTVEVGAQVTGTISAVHADFNDQVKKGDLLLEIDPEQLSAAHKQARARLVAAQAGHTSAKASAKELKLAAERAASLHEKGLVSDQDLQSAQAAAERAAAQVSSSSADIALANASLDQAQTNLDKAWIRSPIDGVVLSRNVELGQTVTSGFQTPVLFTLARDLTQMELSINIDESDIGRIKEGQRASFTVDAYPDRKFPAMLESLHNISKLTDNVVTYEAILSVKNDDLALRPGMTATATVVTVHRSKALLVPNSALRFQPPGFGGGGRPRGVLTLGRPQGPKPKPNGDRKPKVDMKAPHVWLLQKERPRPVNLQLGVSDGQVTEVLSGIKERDAVIVDLAEEPSP